MKKKLLTLLLSCAIVFSTVGGASAAEKNGCSLNPVLSGNLQNMLQQYLSKYFEQRVPEKPEESEKPESPEKPEKPDNSVTQKPQQNAGTKASQVAALVNQQRQKAGLTDLKTDSELTSLAQLKAEDMAEEGYFSHTSPTYGSAFDMLKAAGYSYRTAGENIAMGQKTADAVMNGWMNSSGHRSNILGSRYTKIGVGYAVNARGIPYWVQIFAG